MRSPSMLDYQRQLIASSLDDFTPNAVFANYCGGQYGSESGQWRAAVVDFLCAGLLCGLIELTHRPDISEKRDVDSLREMLLHGDVERSISVDILCDVLYFNGTEKLIELMAKYGLHNWDSLSYGECDGLAMELERICGNLWHFNK